MSANFDAKNVCESRAADNSRELERPPDHKYNVVLNINVFCSQTLKGLKASESKLYEKN